MSNRKDQATHQANEINLASISSCRENAAKGRQSARKILGVDYGGKIPIITAFIDEPMPGAAIPCRSWIIARNDYNA